MSARIVHLTGELYDIITCDKCEPFDNQQLSVGLPMFGTSVFKYGKWTYLMC